MYGAKLYTFGLISLWCGNLSNDQIHHINPSAIHNVLYHIPGTSMYLIIIPTPREERGSHDLINNARKREKSTYSSMHKMIVLIIKLIHLSESKRFLKMCLYPSRVSQTQSTQKTILRGF